MTIKNRGGVFGRNPTFNDVDVDGTLSVGGAAIPAPANTAKLDTAQTFTATQTMASGTGGILTLKTTDATGASGDTLGKIDFFSGDTSGGSTGVQASVRGVYDTNGDSSALVFVTGYSTGSGSPTLVERMRVRSGGGITFNGDTAAANALDDYEEGSFTPVFADASSSGNEASPATANGYYTKIGRQVHIVFELTNINTSGLTAGNDIFITGLPFAPASLTGDIRHSGTFTMTQVSVVGTDIINVAEIRDNLNYLKFRQSTSGDFLTVGEVTSGTADFYVSLTYIA